MILGTGANVKSVGAWFALLLLLCLCVNSWGACRETQGNGCRNGNCTNNIYGCYNYCNGPWQCTPDITLCESYGLGYNAGVSDRRGQCSSGGYAYYYTCCDTQAEADSVACSNDPTLPNCAVVSDTLIFACSDSFVDGQAVATIYRLSCKATNGELTECNGKQDVDIPTDGQPVKQMQGTCAQNGLPNGPFGGATPQDSTELPNGANAECFAITGSKCHMKDKMSGNTFTCDCDGSCQVAIQNLMAGSASCTNPYPQPNSSSDSLHLDSSPSSGASSSDSGGGSSPSSSESGSSGSEGGGNSSEDFEWDYNLVLDAIRANTQYTGSEVNRLNDKADKANDYLQQIANKDWNPTINVGSPNVTLNADTAKAPAQILGLLNDKMSGGEPNAGDTAGTGAELSNIMGKIDSIVGEGTPDMSDSVGNAVRGMHNAYNALKDSLGNSAWSDSVTKWQGQLTNNGTLSGSGSDNCPAVLTRKWNVPLGAVTAEVGPLGKYLCDPIFGGVTGWALARILLRTLVSIFCMIWLFKAVMGIDGGSNDED